MSSEQHYRRGLALSLLVHGVLAGSILWLWTRPQQPAKPEPMIRWDVSMFSPPPMESPPLPMDEPPPELASEPPVETALEPPPPPPPGMSAGAGGPAFSASKMAMPSNTGALGAVGLPTGGLGGGGLTAGLSAGQGAGSGPRPAMAAPDFALSPIVRVPPAYPAEARRKKVEGWVRVEMTVLEDGTVAEAKVKSAEPHGVFDEAALAAVARWKFRPATENGKPVRRRVGQTLKFELNG